jgi:F-type H+-transporting ATPase subunit gamma
VPSLKSIRKRISSVKNTRKITRAMKLVAAARLRRAQDAIVAARPYSAALEQVIGELALRAGGDAHPLLAERAGKRAQIVVMTSDRGLAGSFNAQVLRKTELTMSETLADWDEVGLRVVGRKGNDYFKRRSAEVLSFNGAPTGDAVLGLSRELANHVVEDFLAEKTDRVYVMFNEFKSAISQTPVLRQLLPVKTGLTSVSAGDMVYEPSKEALLEHLLPLYVQNGLFKAALESIASEFGARMSAMDSATRNAGEMIDRLSLQYNRARQAAITKELLEIIGGAEALKG